MMGSISKIFYITLVVLLFPLVSLLAHGVCPIVGDGVAQAVVVANHSDSAVISLATDELVNHIELITGVRLPIVDAEKWDPKETRTTVIVGSGSLLTELGVDLGELPPEGYRVLALPERRLLILAGRDQGNPLATPSPMNMRQEFGSLYAVYAVLEQWGVRWLFPGKRGTVIPRCATLVMARSDRVDAPDFRRRNLWSSEEVPRNKFKETDSTQRAMRLWALRCRSGNSMNEYSSGHHNPRWWNLWGKSHPEYLGLFRGKRGVSNNLERSKLCVSNPDVAQAVAQMALAAFKRGVRSYSICEQDGSLGFCTCPECRAMDLPYPNEVLYDNQSFGAPGVTPLTDRYLIFWNRVAELVDAELPQSAEHYLGVYLYSFYSDVPRNKKPLHRRIRAVYVNNGQIASIELAHRLQEWSQLTPNPLSLYLPPMFGAWPLRDYEQVTVPVMTLNSVHQGMLFCRKQGMAGVLLNPNFKSCNVGSHSLMAYAYSRWLWSADLTPAEILSDFTQHAFGDAASTMATYFKAIAERQSALHLPFVVREYVGREAWLDNVIIVFTPEFVTELEALLNKALVQAQEMDERERVQIFKQNLLFTAAEVKLAHLWREYERARKRGEIAPVMAALRNCEELYGELWYENKTLKPLFMLIQEKMEQK